MTGPQFAAWVADVKSAGLAKTQLQVADLLGVTDQSVSNWKARGTPGLMVDLACAAVLLRLEPYA